jgi:hypothetical protein
VIVKTAAVTPKSSLHAALPELLAVSLNFGFWPGSYEFCALRRVNVTLPLAQSGSADPADSRSPPDVVPPPLPPVPPVPAVEDTVAPALLPALLELPLVAPVSPPLPLPPPLLPPTEPPGRLLFNGPVAEGPGVIDDTGVWPLLPFAPMPLPPLPRELTVQKTTSASTAARHATMARRRQ